MPSLTRSQARSRQPLDQAASPRASPPGRVSTSSSELPQQPSTEGDVSRNNRTRGGRPSSLAAGNERPPADRVRTCRSDCLSCPDLIRNKEFISSTTGRKYTVVGINPEQITCKLQNYIYLLTCYSCYVQIVGESIVPVNLRMNIYRRAKTGCTTFIDHYTNCCCGSKFSIQIIEKLDGDGYLNGAIDEKMRDYRLQREDHWIKTLRTVYPYGLNEKTKGMNEDTPIGKLFPPLPRYGAKYLVQRTRLFRNRGNLLSDLNTLKEHVFSLDPNSRWNETRKLLDSFKHKQLKFVAAEAHQYLENNENHTVQRLYTLIVDTFLTKVYKKPPGKKKPPTHILPIFFDNKGLEHIKLASILHEDDVVNLLPDSLQQEEVPSVVYRLGTTIRNKLFNYKETVNSINTNDLESYGTGITSCDCHNSEFVNDHHGHIVTGDLRIIRNEKLRKLISKGPNYREPKTINWKKCRDGIAEGLAECMCRMASSNKTVKEADMISWRDMILQKVDAKITSLKRKITIHKTNPVLKQPDVVQHLEELHQKYVFVPIDKAANNVAIICKKHYVEVILKEVGATTSSSDTYTMINKPKNEIIEDNIQYSKKIRLKPEDKDSDLPVMYWTPKMHKTPSGCRFIIASKHCSTKPLSKAVSSAFKLIFHQVERFHTKAKFLNNYNKFWVLQNADPIISILNNINRKKRAKSIATYDFSTLYTKLPHNKLITQLSKVIDLVYKGGDKKFISISNNDKAFWSKNMKVVSFSKASLKTAVRHLIENCFFTVGNVVLRQAIGIPMGIDPAPFWANLFLYTYEENYISTLISTNPVKARHFHSTKRFIDDLCAINDGNEFGNVYKDIYPEELELKLEHSGRHADFLHLDITREENIFVYKLYDKRDAFPFNIVRMPQRSSNIPQTIFYSALVGEFLRIARSTLKLPDFIPKAKKLIDRMKKQGADTHTSQRFIRKLILNHPVNFSQFFLSTGDLIESLF